MTYRVCGTFKLVTQNALIAGGAALIIAATFSLSANAQNVETRIFDGFGDADVNNNGEALESEDVNVGGTPEGGEPGTYVPGRLQDDDGLGPINTEVSEVLDASDTGIRWLQIRGWSNAEGNAPGAGSVKPQLRIIDDSQGAMQETAGGGFEVPAIDSGYALSWESRGGGSSAAGFFDETIELGPEVDDSISVSFDYRIWRDAANVNSNTPEQDNVPVQGELRFGLFQDTDNQLGMTNPFAGRQVDEDGEPFADQTTQFNPAVWGEEGGLFSGRLFREVDASERPEGSLIGSIGDNGWTASVFMGDTFPENGGGSRIREELNSQDILEGSDVHTVAQPEDTDPDLFNSAFDFISLDLDAVYNIELSLTRATAEEEGDTIFAELSVTDLATGEVNSFGGLEQLEDHGGVEGTGGIQSDSWDYFAIRNASNGANEFDFLLDNFTVNVIGSNAVTSTCDPGTLGDIDGSGDVAFADFLILSSNFGQAAVDHTTGDIDCSGDVAFADFLVLSSNFGQTVGGAQSVPEPSGLSLLAFAGLMIVGLRRRRS